MTWLVPVALVGLAIAVMAVMAAIGARKQRLAAAQGAEGGVSAAVATPASRILVHSINDDRCTGCDACVAVCPTNVLDLVRNKSRVLRFHDCIQCEACMWACPTEALVMHVEGTEAPKLKVPELDTNFQTAVPGQYLIGEVSGKPLVKNAANLGRAVVEHMLSTGLQPGRLASIAGAAAGGAAAGASAGGAATGAASRGAALAEGSDASKLTQVDVVIVGSGPGGLSAALTCLHRGLSYVVLDKEQIIASTVSRYPKGKLVMAEPYDTQNVSFLPVFDSSKEQLVPVWKELVERVGMQVKLGEAVESVARRADGAFDVKTTVAAYRAQRVVLATGMRGKPRTLQVPGENLPKVASLLEDPDDFRGKHVLVVGGGDSAVEAALALADAGAKVMLSYRGRSFSRAQPKNKQAADAYVAQQRLKVKFQSQVVSFEADTVTIALSDGSHKRYPNQAAFVLIGADPPVQWLEKLGVRFVERPHQYALGKTDDVVRRFLPDAIDCPETALEAAGLVTGAAIDPVAAAAAVAARPPTAMGPTREMTREMARELAQQEPLEPVSGPRKWLRSATNIFTSAKKLEQPMPLSEFARRSRAHTGHGRRDELPASERTRVLRMLRDVGGRLADEESQVYEVSGLSLQAPEAVPAPMMLDDDSPLPIRGAGQVAAPTGEVPGMRVKRTSVAPPLRAPETPPPQLASRARAPMMLDDEDDSSAPKQAVIVGLQRAQARGPQLQSEERVRRPTPSSVAAAGGTPPAARTRRPSPPPAPRFTEEPTRRVDPSTDLARLLRETRSAKPPLTAADTRSGFFDEATRAVDMDPQAAAMLAAGDDSDLIDVSHLSAFEDQRDESTRAVDLSGLAALERASSNGRRNGHGAGAGNGRRAPLRDEESTRAVALDRAGTLSDVDWDLD